MNLDDRRVLITGGGSGIGLALARALAPSNRVTIAGRDISRLDRAKAAVPSLQTLRLDLTSEEQVAVAMDSVRERAGGLDLLVNSAGVMLAGDVSSPDAGSAAATSFDVNVLGSLRMTRLALPLLRRSDDGAVVFVSSALALVSAPGLAVYAATKAATHSIARSLRRELRDEIKVFDVVPPWVDTELAADIGGDKLSPNRSRRRSCVGFGGTGTTSRSAASGSSRCSAASRRRGRIGSSWSMGRRPERTAARP